MNERPIAWTRSEKAPCEYGTNGCAIAHAAESVPSVGCECW